MLRLRTLGGLSLEGGTGPLTGAATRRRPLALLALLAAAGEQGVSRDKLYASLWPESDTERARNSLKQVLFALRRDLRAPELVLGTSELRLNPEVISSDAAEFEQALAREELERAAVLYRGPFLDGFHLSDAPEFERWVDGERSRLAESATRALERLAKDAAACGDHEVAAGWWRRLATLDPLNGRIALNLMNALAAAGDRAGALLHARVYQALLREELDSAPDPAVSALAERLRQTPGTPRPDQGRPAPLPLPARTGTPPQVADARETRETSSLRIARVLAGCYEVQRELAHGAMATVYLAHDLRRERPVALKILHPELAAALGRERFLREIRFAARLQHPHILPLYDSGEAEGTLFYAMPYVEGECLRDRLNRERQLPLEDALRIAREVADALAYAHDHDVIHRDIKPENILLSGGHAVVADFGIARALTRAAGSRITESGFALGTPAYMSPEQASGEYGVDGRSDIYSLGCVLYEMLAGEPPFTGPTAQAVIARRFSTPLPRLRLARESVPAAVEAVINRALAPVPADRFPTARAFTEALHRCEVSAWRDRQSGEGAEQEAEAPAARAVVAEKTDTSTPAAAFRDAVEHPITSTPAEQLARPTVPPDRVAPSTVPPETAGTTGRAFSRRRLPSRAVLVGAAALAVAGGAALYFFPSERRQHEQLDPTLVVVAPYTVLAPGLQFWREGMVDVLSRNLDGAGSIRTVSPTVAIRRWQGRADARSAADLARGTGAGIALFGALLPAGGDSAQATATLVDAATGRVLGGLERREAVTRMDRLTDSLTVAILRELGERQSVGATPRTPLGSVTSLEALKAFLHGEDFYRRSQWDSALAYYEHAVSHDSAFPLALRRAGQVLAWQRLVQDSLSLAYLLRAGAHNRGLGPLDSLLVAADSLGAAATVTESAPEQWSLVRRLFATLSEAVRRYPHAPGVWFSMGEARYHFGFGPVVGVSERETLDAFDRAIALDSVFAPSYIHAVELGFNLGGAPLGLRYARAYLARNPTEPAHRGIRLVQRLVDPEQARSEETERILDTISADVLVSARTALRRWPDPAETAVRLSRLLAEGRPSTYPLFADTGFMRRRLAEELAFRGHLREAYQVLGTRELPIFAELALLGAVPPDTAARVFAHWLEAGSKQTRLALPWWSTQRDTASIVAFARRVFRLARTATRPDERMSAAYDAAAAQAYLAVARHDSAEALRRLGVLPDTFCIDCYMHRLTRARLLAARGHDREALATLGEPLTAFLTPMEVVFALERARVAERLKERGEALRSYRFVYDAWVRGDPELRPLVDEARRALHLSRSSAALRRRGREGPA